MHRRYSVSSTEPDDSSSWGAETIEAEQHNHIPQHENDYDVESNRSPASGSCQDDEGSLGALHSMHSQMVVSTTPLTEPRSNRQPCYAKISTSAVPFSTKGKPKIIKQESPVKPNRPCRRRRYGIVLATIWVVSILLVILWVVITKLTLGESRKRVLPGVETTHQQQREQPTAAPKVTESPLLITNTTTTTATVTLCNGHENLCQVRANEMLFATLHNAASSSDPPQRRLSSSEAPQLPNHELPLEEALVAGYRGLNLDLGKCDNGELRFVNNGQCSSDGSASRDPVQVLTNIVEFLQANPNEVILMPMQINDGAGGGRVFLKDIIQLFDTVPGLMDLLFAHPGLDYPWPVLQDLIDTDKRILFFFYDAVETCKSITVPCPAGFHDWFDYAIETAFEFDTVADLHNATGSCAITRGMNGSHDFFGINVFTSTPGFCQEVNAAAFLQPHMQECSEMLFGVQPNLLTVDCWNVGDVLDTVDQHNAAILPAATQQANIHLALVGATGVMGNQTVIRFVHNCNRFFSHHLATDAITNVACNVVSQNELPNDEIVQVLVQVSGDMSPGTTNVFNSSTLEAVIDDSGEMFRTDLGYAGKYFEGIHAIQVVGAGQHS